MKVLLVGGPMDGEWHEEPEGPCLDVVERPRFTAPLFDVPEMTPTSTFGKYRYLRQEWHVALDRDDPMATNRSARIATLFRHEDMSEERVMRALINNYRPRR